MLKERDLKLCAALGTRRSKGEGPREVVPVESYEGVFVDGEGAVYDMRPQEGKPSIANFSKMEKSQLQKLLLAAEEEQLR